MPPASDKGQYVDFEVRAWTAAAFYTGAVLPDMIFWHTPAYFNLGVCEDPSLGSELDRTVLG